MAVLEGVGLLLCHEVGDVGAAEGWGGEAEEFERSKNVKCEQEVRYPSPCSTEIS